MKDPDHLSQPFTWQQFSQQQQQLSWTRHWNWLFLRRKLHPEPELCARQSRALGLQINNKHHLLRQRGKNKTLGNFSKNVREISVSCPALALLLRRRPSAGGLWCQCTCWGSQRCPRKRRWRPPGCGNSSARASSSHTAGKRHKQKGKKKNEGRGKKQNKTKKLFSPQERQEIGFKLTPG